MGRSSLDRIAGELTSAPSVSELAASSAVFVPLEIAWMSESEPSVRAVKVTSQAGCSGPEVDYVCASELTGDICGREIVIDWDHLRRIHLLVKMMALSTTADTRRRRAHIWFRARL